MELFQYPYLLLSLPHGEKLELVAAELDPVGKLHEITGRVGTWAQDKHNRGHGRALFKHVLEADDWRRDVLLTDRLGHVLGHRPVDPVHAEAAQQHQPLELAQFLLVVHRECQGLWGVVVKPLGKGIE